MVGCLCPIIRPQQVAAAGLLLWAWQPGDADCCMADAQQQLRAVSHCRADTGSWTQTRFYICSIMSCVISYFLLHFHYNFNCICFILYETLKAFLLTFVNVWFMRHIAFFKFFCSTWKHDDYVIVIKCCSLVLFHNTRILFSWLTEFALWSVSFSVI